MRYASLKDLDEAGLDVRPWCFACGRGGHVDAIIWQLFQERVWPLGLVLAARRFTCSGCGSWADVLLVPATRPPARPWSGAEVVAAYFHQQRSAAKKLRRGR